MRSRAGSDSSDGLVASEVALALIVLAAAGLDDQEPRAPRDRGSWSRSHERPARHHGASAAGLLRATASRTVLRGCERARQHPPGHRVRRRGQPCAPQRFERRSLLHGRRVDASARRDRVGELPVDLPRLLQGDGHSAVEGARLHRARHHLVAGGRHHQCGDGQKVLAERGAGWPTHQDRVGGGAHVQHSRGRGRQREALRSRRRGPTRRQVLLARTVRLPGRP